MLSDLLDALVPSVDSGPAAVTSRDIEISAVDYDSRRVVPGSLFCCLQGLVADGHDFAEAAIARGAVALLSERRLDVDVPDVVVPNAREAMGHAAALLNGRPSDALDVVGITGTNGKTTVAHLVEQLADRLGRSAAVIGTLTGERTTPESPDIQARLAELRGEGTEVVAMEVSSHALEMRRVVGTRFRVVVFTNLSPEHLDFHRDMEQYFEAKARLFTSDFADAAVVNIDNEYGRRLAGSTDLPVVAVDLSGLGTVEVGLAASRFNWRGHDVTLPLGGAFNVRNATMAAEVMVAMGDESGPVAAALEHLAPVPGRFERVDAGQEFDVIVDYAHTPDGLTQLLDTVAGATGDGAVLVVFGCGGERDRAKRPHMGAAVSDGADRAWLTSDNPRREDPDQIIADVLDGVAGSNVDVIRDRREAIEAAISVAEPNDVVVIAGKGHETTQTIGVESFPFDDRLVARDILLGLAGTSGVSTS